MTQKLRILTWNIWNYNQWVERKAHLVDSIRVINPDIIAFQEIRRNYLQEPDQATQLERELPGYSIVVQPAAIAEYYWEGLAIFSKNHIARVNYLGLSRDQHDIEDAPHQRIVLGARVEWGEKSVCVFNTHLSLSEAARLRTVREVLQFIEAFSAKNDPVILVGDFNAQPHEKAIEAIRQSKLGLKDAWEESHNLEAGETWEIPTLSERLDYIFYGKALSLISCERVGLKPDANGVYPSDHCGLVADFKL